MRRTRVRRLGAPVGKGTHMLHGWKRIVVAVLTALLLFDASPIPAMASVLSNAPAENEQILSELGSIAGSEDEAERYYELMERYGLLDEDGNPVESWTIQMDGKDVTLDEIREMLAGDYDAAKTVTVDGTPVTLGDLDTMLQIEDYVAHVKDTYFSDQEWTDEQKASLESLENQINSEGIEILGTEGELAFPSGVDHSVRISIEGDEGAQENGIYTITAKLNHAQEKAPVSFEWVALPGTVSIGGTTSGEVSFAPGETEKTISVQVGGKNGTYLQGGGSFLISVFHAKNAIFSENGADSRAINKKVKVACSEQLVYQTEAKASGHKNADWAYESEADPSQNYGDYHYLYSGDPNETSGLSWITGQLPLDEELASGSYEGTLTGSISHSATPFERLTSNDVPWDGNGWYNIYFDGNYLSRTNYSINALTITSETTWKDTLNFTVSVSEAKPSYTYELREYFPWKGNVITSGVTHNEVRAPAVDYDLKLELREKTTETSASLSAPTGTYVPGQQIPITVSFGFPMEISDDMTLTFGEGDAKQVLTPVEVGATSDKATFLYTVESTDGARLDFRSATLDGKGANGRDIMVSLSDKTEINDALAGAQLVTPAKRDALTGFSATIENPLTAPVLNISVPVSENEKLTAWLTAELTDDANVDQEAGIARSTSLKVSIDGTNMVPLTTPLEGGQDEPLTLTAQISLPLNTTGNPVTYVPELYIDGSVVLDITQPIELVPAVFITGDDLSPAISVETADGEPYIFADNTHTIYAQDAPKIKASIGLTTEGEFSFGDTSNTTTFTVDADGNRTFADPTADFAWRSTDPTVATIAADGTITSTGKAGTASFELVALNGNVVVDGTSKMVAKTATYTFTLEGGQPQTISQLTFGAGLTPFLLIPNKAINAVDGQNVTVYWSSNLCDKNGEEPTSFTVTVKDAEGDTVEVPEGAEGISNPMIETGTAASPAASVTIPAALLTYSYKEGVSNTFTVEVEATFEGKTYTDDATISLASQPAVVTLTSLPSYYILDTQGTQRLDWTIEHFDRAESDNQDDVFKFQLLKNDEKVDADDVELTRGDDGTAKGSYTINFGDIKADPSDPTSYRDVYTVTVQAKNGTDSTWSYDSFVLYVYDADALQILVDGEKDEDGTLLMSNREVISKMSQADILDLNRDISLKNAISINYGEYAWQELSDQIAWASSNSSVASVNYQQGTLYENIENFSYTSYRPTEDFVLSGLSDGEVSVTATHKLTGMKDLLDVKVETLTNRLYLFQCYPQAATTLSFDIYTDAEHSATKHVEITSEDNGRAAYYAEFGIASDVYCTSKGEDGNTYLGTFYQSDLKTGEQDSTKLELYPVNNLQMRRAAYAYLYLKNPDGTPYTGSVIFRGGVYVNDEYIEGAKFKLNGQDTVSKLGNQDTTVTLGGDGKLEVTMDQTQWGLEDGAVLVGDVVRYVFQLECGDSKEYYPLLVTVDATANEDAIVGTGEAVVNFRENTEYTSGETDGEHPFVIGAVESYSNYGTPMNVLDYTGKVGPSDSLPEATLTLVTAWWGDEKPDDPAAAPNTLVLKTGDGIAVADGQGESSISHEAYPFSDMLLTTYTMRLNSATMDGVLGAGGRTEARLEYSEDGTEVSRTETLPFQLCNMLTIGKVTELDSVSNLVQNMGGYAGTSAPITMDGKDAFVDTLLNLVADDDYTTGNDKLFSIQIAPTEDPTKFLGFIEANIGNMSDKDQVTGVYAQPGQTEDFDYTPGLAEVLMMTGVKSPMQYGMGQMDDFFKATKSKGVRNISFDIGGYAESLIYYNNDTGKWSIQILDGGFNAGGGMSYSWNYNTMCGPIPFTATLTAGGTAEVSMDALTVGYFDVSTAEYDFGNDFLTELRIYLYLRFFAGVGFDYSIIAFKLGVFGQVNLDMQFQWLNRPYMDVDNRVVNVSDGSSNKDDTGAEKKVNLAGQSFKIDGQVGLEFVMKLLFISYEKVLFSFDFNLLDEKTGDWNKIQANWSANSAAMQKTISELLGTGSATLNTLPNGQQMLSLNLAPTLESRDYLSQGDRAWNGGGIQLFSLDSENGLKDLETNSYPYANPVLTDDGELLAYVTDCDSTDVEKTRAAYAIKSGTSYTDKGVLPTPKGDTDGYGDSQLSLAGTGSAAVAAWTRQTVSLDKDADSVLTDANQMMMMNGTDVYASVWNGSKWATTRLSKNDAPDMAPVVATNGKTGEELRAVVAWRAVQSSGDNGTAMMNPTNFDVEDTIVYKVYDGSKSTWSDAETLYNGTSGAVKAIVAAMLSDGTAAVAYTLDRDGADATTTDREIAYGVIDPKTGEVSRSVIATKDNYLDENPQIAAVTFPGAGKDDEDAERFVLGWYTEQAVATDGAAELDGGTGPADSQETVSDIRFVDFDGEGATGQLMPDSMSSIADSYGVNITSNFRFSKGAGSIDDLSIVWAERAEGETQELPASQEESDASDATAERDVLKSVKFYTMGAKNEIVRTTAAATVAEMSEGTLIDHFDVYVSDPEKNELKAAILGSTYGEGGKTLTRTAETVAGDTVQFTVPQRTTGMYTATLAYTDGIDVPNFVADYETVRKGATTQIQFTVENTGIHTIDQVDIKVGNKTTTYGDHEGSTSELNLLPGESIQLTADYQVPADKVVDPDYVVTAHFDMGEGATGTAQTDGERGLFELFAAGVDSAQAEGTVYLNLPDVEVTDARVVSEEEGKRTIQVKFNNGSDAELAGSGRKVELGFYTDATCETPIATKYFVGSDGTRVESDEPFTMTITGEDDLSMLDNGGYAAQVTFDAAAFAHDAKGDKAAAVEEIPDLGIPVYIKAVAVESSQAETGANEELGDPVPSNNYGNVTAENLAVRTGEEVSINSAMAVDDAGTTVTVDLQNNRLAQKTTGNLIVTLLGADGKVIAQQQSYKQGTEEGEDNGLITLEGEGVETQTFTFEGVTNATEVRVTYSDAVLDENNAGLASVSVDGVALTYDEATKTWTGSGDNLPQSLVTIVPENLDATVTVNGQPYNGADLQSFSRGENRFEIVVTAPDGTTTETYYLVIANNVPLPAPTGNPVTVAEGSGHGTVEVDPERAREGQTVTVTPVPDEGYAVGSVTVTTEDGTEVPVTEGEDGTWTFTMPAGAVTVEVGFHCLGGEACPTRPFGDVPVDAWYHDTMDWAVEEGLLTGYEDGTIGPDNTLSRSQLVTMLWRRAGSPETDAELTFTDCDPDAFYADAVAWAASEGIVMGYGDGSSFGPEDPVTREQLAVIFWRQAGEPEASTDLSAFADGSSASAYAVPALKWAVETSLLFGFSDGTLAPGGALSRAQTAAMFMRQAEAESEGAEE